MPSPLPHAIATATALDARVALATAATLAAAALAAAALAQPAALRTSDNLTAPPAMHFATNEPSWGSEARRDGSGAVGGSKGEVRLAVGPGANGRTGGASSSSVSGLHASTHYFDAPVGKRGAGGEGGKGGSHGSQARLPWYTKGLLLA